MLRLKKIAVTGVPGSGKSTLLQFFREEGAYVVQTDALVHKILEEEPIKKKVTLLLGPEILEEGKLSRQKIAKKVFNNPDDLFALEKLIHPEVFKRIDLLEKEIKAPVFFVEVPLLFEIGAEKKFDATILVSAPKDACKNRFQEKNFEERWARLQSEEEKKKKASYIIVNNGSLEELREKARKLYSKLK